MRAWTLGLVLLAAVAFALVVGDAAESILWGT
jgi:hypothetical protein